MAVWTLIKKEQTLLASPRAICEFSAFGTVRQTKLSLRLSVVVPLPDRWLCDSVLPEYSQARFHIQDWESFRSEEGKKRVSELCWNKGFHQETKRLLWNNCWNSKNKSWQETNNWDTNRRRVNVVSKVYQRWMENVDSKNSTELNKIKPNLANLRIFLTFMKGDNRISDAFRWSFSIDAKITSIGILYEEVLAQIPKCLEDIRQTEEIGFGDTIEMQILSTKFEGLLNSIYALCENLSNVVHQLYHNRVPMRFDD